MKEDIKEPSKETKKLSYKDASGEIQYTLRSDIVFHYTMQKSDKALLGLVCALRGIKPADVKSILVENPIDLNNIGKESVMDLKLTLNSGVIMNIELQMYTDKFWIPRSILYMCRAFDCIKEGDDYSKLKKTVHYCITDQDLFNAEPEFYAKYALLNKRTYEQYSDMIGINVLQLQYLELATQEDVDNDLVYWAKLFKANTWEEIQTLVQEREDLAEVADMILELNTDNQAKEILEGQRRYREQMASQYAAGCIDTEEKYRVKLEEKDMVIEEKDKVIEEKDKRLEAKDEVIEEQGKELDAANQTIADLRKQLEELKKK